MQSPINIDSPDLIHLNKDLTLKFTKIQEDVKAEVENTGKTLKSSFEWMEMELSIEGITQQLQTSQLHFKAPSEHTFNGNHYSLEMQIVSKNLNQKGTYVVLSLLMEANRKVGKNELADPFAAIAYNLKSKGMTGSVEINFADALTRELGKLGELEFFTYLGSITTPPCVENVRWIIVTQPLQISFEEMNSFTDLWKGNTEFAGGNGNNRRQQELYGRDIGRGEILELEKQYINKLIAQEKQNTNENIQQQSAGLNYYSPGVPSQQSPETHKSKLYYMPTYDSKYLKNPNEQLSSGITMMKKGKHSHKLQKYAKVIPKIEPQISSVLKEKKIKEKVSEIFKQQSKNLKKAKILKEQKISVPIVKKEKKLVKKEQKKLLSQLLRKFIKRNKNCLSQLLKKCSQKRKQQKIQFRINNKRSQKSSNYKKKCKNCKLKKSLKQNKNKSFNPNQVKQQTKKQTILKQQIKQILINKFSNQQKKIDTLKKESNISNDQDLNQEMYDINVDRTEKKNQQLQEQDKKIIEDQEQRKDQNSW
eukprot:TRINITY_DN4053_c0_g1_i6.p1 TRINITY_DN4053_c0_g1~~TRINITY_DN4053_c0_g1_i6.p1  ORF type:complete len:533 (+),score=105.47 TRINITY_DN4053_c0_g1_i6:311-1909(+)